jgi:hypothetical protein
MLAVSDSVNTPEVLFWVAVPVVAIAASTILWRRGSVWPAVLQIIGAAAFLFAALYDWIILIALEHVHGGSALSAYILSADWLRAFRYHAATVAALFFIAGFLWHALRAAPRI